jgi:DNA-binding phage protein
MTISKLTRTYKYLTEQQSEWMKARAIELYGTMEKAARAADMTNISFYNNIMGRHSPSVLNVNKICAALKIKRFPSHGEPIELE